MANNLQRVHGDVQGVFHMDTANGAIVSNTAPAGTCVNFVGGSFDFFRIDSGSVSFAAEMDAGGAVEAILQNISQLATVMMYQVDSGTGGELNVCVYPKGVYEANSAVSGANLTAQLQLLTSVGHGPLNLNAASVTNVGFKLASS